MVTHLFYRLETVLFYTLSFLETRADSDGSANGYRHCVALCHQLFISLKLLLETALPCRDAVYETPVLLLKHTYVALGL